MMIHRTVWVSAFVALGFSTIACSSDSTGSGTNAATSTGGGTSTGGSTSSSGGSTATGSGGAKSTGGTTGTAGAGTGGGTSGATPTIKIDDPKDGETVGPSAEYADYPDVPIAFTVTGFTLKAPGACAGAAGCGHIHLLVDGTACNDVANKAPYNNAGATSPINAGLDYCAKVEGAHTISMEIHNDDHSPVKGADGKVISDSIKITAMPEAAMDAGAGTDAKAP